MKTNQSRNNSNTSRVEKAFALATNQREDKTPGENLHTLVVDSFPVLGTLTAARFLEWVQHNPEGVISLPTGKTPEYFIKEVQRFLNSWTNSETCREMESLGLDISRKPDLSGLHFVQIDEFYPINPNQHNSFYDYVNKFYLDGFQLSPERAMLINCEQIGLPKDKTLEDIWGSEGVDLSLRYRNPITRKELKQRDVIFRVDQWCSEYEEKIRQLGGLGFFLGGIGPDGHIGFNVRGADRNSTTRLSEINYETQAAAASDLGGIETARQCLVITIGISTITYNPNCTALIIAAGEAKADIVRDAIESPVDNRYPASALQKLPNARFYVTQGAAKHLKTRNLQLLKSTDNPEMATIEKIVIDLSLSKNKPIAELETADYKTDDFGKILFEKIKDKTSVAKIGQQITESLKNKISRGLAIPANKVFLHTEPHHDDIMLGYMPHVVRAVREHSNHHHFVTLTSGFTAVTNGYMRNLLEKMKTALAENQFDKLWAEHYFDPDNDLFRNRDVWRYLDGVAADSEEIRLDGTLRRLLRILFVIFDEKDLHNIANRVDELINYFETQYAGKKDLPYIQTLKGMIREWESACLWGHLGWNESSIYNLRLGFYSGEIFTEEPTVNRDVLPILNLLRKVQPDVISLAFDPEGSGPDTHYKVLQAIAEALKLYEKETPGKTIEVLGYRNIWYRFHPSEANMFIPVSLNMFSLMHDSFMNTYISQKEASFPSYAYDGPFSKLAQRIQVEQFEQIKTCLGRGWFFDNDSAFVRAIRGLVYLQSMTTEEFYMHSRALKNKAERPGKF